MNERKQPRTDPAWIRGMTQRRMSRRDVLRYAGVGASALGLSSILAACGVEGEQQTTGPTAGGEGSPEWWADMKAAGPGDHINFTNWPAYIDRDFSIEGPGSRPSLFAFIESTGIDVTYRADINANEDFYAAIRPAMEAGQDTGHDIIVITNGQELTEMIQLGYLIELDPELRPNFDANAGPTFRDPAFDPGNVYTMAWQSGMTGIAYNTKYVDEPITTLEGMLNPKYAGHVAMFGNNADAPCLAMIELGIDPETSTPDDWQQAADFLQRFNESGVLRQWTDQAYLTGMENEDLWVSMAWSGDILNDKLYYPEFATFEFTTPEAGGIVWVDNCCIPNNAANPVGAMMLMDWYYQPEYAAMLTEWNAYVSPVPAGGEIVQADAAAAKGANKEVLETIAASPYVFPPPELEAKLHNYRVLEGDEIETWNDLFLPIFLT
ncbi:MAG TPA: spermidine/putrescine ABC transporter substrate-binding protein [Actinomycetota bacterium]|nr:spermidine/putrescine ABC transporter substrate-binding protein [Actinomycetota bacterium]